jgi:hypothetical protein
MKELIIFFAFIFITKFAHSQAVEQDFSHFEKKYGKIDKAIEINGKIYLAGKFQHNQINHPSLICIDTIGNIIWSSGNLDAFQYNLQSYMGAFKSLIDGKDGFLYASGVFGSYKEIWKIDITSGAIIWKSEFSSIASYYVDCILNFENNTLLAYFNDTNQFKHLSVIDKSNGNILSNTPVCYNSNSDDKFSISTDQNFNVYLSKMDSIFKLDHLNLGTVLWKKKHTLGQLLFANYIHYDTLNNQIIYVGKSNAIGHRIMKCDPANGNFLSVVSTDYLYQDLKELKVKDSLFYSTWSHTTVGGINSKTVIAKYNFLNNSSNWVSSFDFPETAVLDEESALSLDIDSNGDVYATGYFADANFGPANWSVVKLSGLTGDTLFTQRIIGENVNYEHESIGIGVFIINNKVYYLGNLESRSGNSYLSANLVKQDLANGSEIYRRNIGDTFDFSSKGIQVLKFINDTYLRFDQRGRVLSVSRYTNSNSLIWNKTIDTNFFLIGHKLFIRPNGNILVSACQYGQDFNPPYYSNVAQKIFIFELTENGTVVDIKHGSFNSDIKLLDMYEHDQNIFLLYSVNGYCSLAKMDNSGYPSIFNLTIQDNQSEINPKLFFPKTTGYSNVFINVNGFCQFGYINESNGVEQILDLLPNTFKYINYIEPIDNNRVLITGQSNTLKELSALYDISLLDTVWTKKSTLNGSGLKLIRVSDSVSFVIGKINNDISVNKINHFNGNASSYYSYNGLANNVDIPLDATYDSIRNYLFITGYETDNLGNTIPLMIKLDSLLLPVDTMTMALNSYNRARANTIDLLSNGTVIFGGTYLESGLKKGFYSIAETAYPPICDSSTNSYFIDSIVSCDSLLWIDGNIYYSSTSSPVFNLTNSVGCDSIITLNLTIIQSVASTVNNGFSMPSSSTTCNGEIALTITGNAPFNLDFDAGTTQLTSNGYSVVNNLCPGVHDLLVMDNCGDTLLTQIVIPIDSNYVFNNPFLDSLAIDSLGVTMTNCEIYYNVIDTAYIDSIWANGNTVNVIWNIVDSNGSNFDTTSYVLNNGNGVYWLQLSVFCPNKAFGDYFAVTEAIYFNNGSVSTAGLGENELNNIGLFPNPTSEIVTISMNAPSANLRVYDIQGKLVAEQQVVSGSEISLKEFQTGVYLFEVISEGNRTVKRVVKN